MKTQNLDKKEDSISEIIKPYIKKWKFFLIFVTIFLIMGYVFIKKTTPEFEILTKILIKDAKKSGNPADQIPGMEGLSGFSGFSSNTVENEMEVFSSKRLISQILTSIPLQCTVYLPQTFYDIELYKNQSPVLIRVINEKPLSKLPKEKIKLTIKGNVVHLSSKEIKNIEGRLNKVISLPFANIMIIKNKSFNPKFVEIKDGNFDELYFTYKSKEKTIDYLQESLFVNLSNKDATVINLSLKEANIKKAEDILNTLVYEYNQEAIIEKNTESEKTKKFIDSRITLISQELGDVEIKKENFKTKNDIVDIGTQATIDLQTNIEAERKKLELGTQLELNELYINYLNSKTNDQMLPANLGLDNEFAASNILEYNKLIGKRNKLLENSTVSHPLVISIDKEIVEMRSAIKESLQKSKSNILLTIGSISSLERKSSNEIGKVPVQERLFRDIERQQQIKENLYLLLLKKREETAITLAMSSDKARVLDFAYSNKKPVSPKKMVILGISLFLGLCIPFLIIFFKQFFNTKISNKNSISKLTELPVIAEIPRLKANDSALIQHNDVSPLAEAFRILTTNINLILSFLPKTKVILVTSSVKGEGKTFVSINLALSFAKPGKKVLLIGSDIRNPQLQRYNPERKSAKGLTEFLYGSIDNIQEIIYPSNVNNNCDFIYSGIIPPNPVELLESSNYSKLIDSLKELYDYIIIDSAPLMPVTDTFIISKFADLSLYVMRSEKTEKDFIEFANHTSAEKKLKKINIVLNDVKAENFGYGNQQGYGYNNTDEKKGFFSKIKLLFS